ncbi:MAG: transporter, partial [Lysobacterales bacterium]
MPCLLFLVSSQVFSQDLEPRRWSWLPTGANFLGFAASGSTGDIYLDPLLKATDATVDYALLGVNFIHTFGLFGKQARVDINAPYASAHWEGLLNDVPASTRRRGFLDPWVRFSINLYGAPALEGKAFQQYMAQHPINTTVGAAIIVIPPLGDYNSKRLINLGNNRWAVRPQIGVLHAHSHWEFE